jgi:hypothetical protein
MVPSRDGRVDTCHCPHESGGHILILHDGSPPRIEYVRWDNPSLPVHQPSHQAGHPTRENRHALI